MSKETHSQFYQTTKKGSIYALYSNEKSLRNKTKIKGNITLTSHPAFSYICYEQTLQTTDFSGSKIISKHGHNATNYQQIEQQYFSTK